MFDMSHFFKRFLIFLAILSGALGMLVIVVLLYFPQVFIYVLTIYWKYSPNKTPYAYVVPSSTIQIESLPIDNTSLSEISAGPISIYIQDSKDIEIHRFKNGNVAIIRPGMWFIMVHISIPDLAASLREDPKFDLDRYSQVYGEEILRSRFDFHSAILKTTPRSVSITSSKRDVVRATVFLIYKSLLIPTDLRGGYYLRVGEIRGIQMGDPSHGDTRVYINLYPDNDSHYQITMNGFQQQKVNEILGRVRFNPT